MASIPHHETEAFWPNLLPDEILLKIVRLIARASFTFKSHGRNIPEVPIEYDHDVLINMVSKISSRFRNVASDESLWRGIVFVCIDEEEKMQQVINECLGSGTRHLCVKGYGMDSPMNLATLAEKCPNLRTLELHGCRLPPWAAFDQPWSSLENLFLVCASMSWNMFENGELHLSLPNIRRLDLYMPQTTNAPTENHNVLLLPDLNSCAELDTICLENGHFMMPRMPSFHDPLPPHLGKLVVYGGNLYKYGKHEKMNMHEFLSGLSRGLRLSQIVGWWPEGEEDMH